MKPLTEPLYAEPPIHCDGGKYFVWGFEQGKADRIVLDTQDWAYNGSMFKDGFSWFGLYNFGDSEIEDLINGDTSDWIQLRLLLKTVILKEGSIQNLNDEQREKLACLYRRDF